MASQSADRPRSRAHIMSASSVMVRHRARLKFPTRLYYIGQAFDCRLERWIGVDRVFPYLVGVGRKVDFAFVIAIQDIFFRQQPPS